MDVHGSASRFQFGAVTIIPDERLVLKDGRPVSLTPKAFDLLAVLVANPGRLLTKEQLMESVWPDAVVEESNLAYHVFAIRRALGEHADADRSIETVPRSGYRFVAPVERIEAERPTAPAPLAEPPVQPRPAARLRPWLGAAGGLALGALTFMGFAQLRQPPVPGASVHFQEPVTGRLAETGMFSVSPDGQHLVFAAEGADGVMRLWARAMNTLQAAPLPGTEVFTIVPPVVWSPDSRFVAFDPGRMLKKVGLDGGAAQSVCELPSTAVGGTWNRDGDILLGNAGGGLVRCPASGGAAMMLPGPDLPEGERHIFPSFLSDGRRFIYLRVSRTNPETSGIYAGELDAAPTRDGPRLITTGFGAAFVPAAGSDRGVIVFARDGTLFSQRFDERRLEMIGSPVRLADHIGSYLDGAFFSVSPTALVYRAPEPEAQLTWFDRGGQELGRVGTPARFSGLALSPGDDRAVVTTLAPEGTANADLWLFELSRTAIPRRVTFEPALEFWPVWSGNDRFVFGSGGGSSGIYQLTVDGERQLVFRTDRTEIPTSMSLDGRILLYTTLTGAATGGDIWTRTGSGGSAQATALVQHEGDQSQAQLSADGRWVAYVSNEAGPNEIFVTGLRLDPASNSLTAGPRIRVSEGGGSAPRWRRDGRELFYLAPDGSVMAVEVDGQREFRPAPATRLFRLPGVIPEWGVSQDGRRFLFAVPLTPPPPFTVIKDWQTGLPQ